MLIFPAIDIIGGEVVRLTRGDYGAVKKYAMTPQEAAQSFYDGGARCLHAVDLDGAKSGNADNAETVKQILCSAPLFTEVGGGIRTTKQIEAYLSAGVGRVILGTVAAKDPEFVKYAAKAYPSRIAVGVDAKDGKVAVNGWLEDTGMDSFDFCRTMRDIGVEYVIYTDISKDGALSGTNLAAYEKLSKIEGLNVTASGGVTYESEICALKEMGIYAVILGKALYEKKITLQSAIAAAGVQQC